MKLFLNRNKAARVALKGDDQYGGGDFRSAECIAFLREADIVVTNPPFSLFRQYVAQLVEHGKKFLIIANKNAITYKEIFPLIRDNKLWTGATGFSGGMWFVADYTGKYEKIVDGVKLINVPAIWFANLDHGRRHQELPLMTADENMRFSKHKEVKGKAAYIRYDNYDAIEVPYTDAIPRGYNGVMGVPITFLDKYNPDQFEILGLSRYTETKGMSKEFVDAYYKSGQTGMISEGHPDLCYYDHNNKPIVPYMRVLIRKRKAKKK